MLRVSMEVLVRLEGFLRDVSKKLNGEVNPSEIAIIPACKTDAKPDMMLIKNYYKLLWQVKKKKNKNRCNRKLTEVFR